MPTRTSQTPKAHGQVVSHAHGRIRVRVRPEHRSQDTLDQIQARLGGHGAIASVATNARTGSVLVQYDHAAVTPSDLLAMLRDAGLAIAELAGGDELPDLAEPAERAIGSHSSTATGLLDVLTDLDERLARATGGHVDIKLLVPLGLGALALRQIALNGLGLGQVPGYVLLWYTFDSFYKLHQRKIERATEHDADDLMDVSADPDA